MNYWTDEHTAGVRDYLTTGRLPAPVARVLYEIASRSLTSLNLRDTEDSRQDIVCHLYFNVLPKIAPDKVEGSLQYLWMAARNYSLSNLTEAPEDPVDLEAVGEVPLIEGDHDRRVEAQMKILKELDLRLRGQRIANCTNAVFLMLLRKYILDNDFDVRGFGDYVQAEMHLKLTSYRAICNRLGLRTFQFNEPRRTDPADSLRVVAIRNGRGVIYAGIRPAARALGVDPGNLRACLSRERGRSRIGEYYFFYLRDRDRWVSHLGVVTNNLKTKKK